MKCDTAREAISALLDGEQPAVDGESLREHLASCATCRVWREDAHEVTRRARLTAAAPVAGPPRALLATLAEANRARRRRLSATLARVGLVLLALAQIALTAPMLLAGSYRDAPIHVAHEMGSLDLALAVGFLVAAWRPIRAHGMRALVGAAALMLVLTATIDLIAHRTTPMDEAPHLLTIAGWLLLVYLGRVTPASQDPPLRFPIAWLHRRQRLESARVFSDVDGEGPPEADARSQPAARQAATVPETLPGAVSSSERRTASG